MRRPAADRHDDRDIRSVMLDQRLVLHERAGNARREGCRHRPRGVGPYEHRALGIHDHEIGNVVITTTDGKRLTSPHVRYSQSSNEVSSDSAFTLVESGKTISGIGFRSDPQLNQFQILRGARGRGSFTLPGQ